MRLGVSEWTEKYMTKPETDSLAADGPLSRTVATSFAEEWLVFITVR